MDSPWPDIRAHRLPFAIGAVGCVASILILLGSTGSNDIRTWEGFAAGIREHGLFEMYRLDRLFNHPPLMGLLAWLSASLAETCGCSFAVVFKTWPVLANFATGFVLWAMWREKTGARHAAWVFALWQWSLCSILVAAYHGNTDCTCASLVIVSLYFLQTRGRPFLAGLAMALAINVKIIPLLVVCPMFCGCRTVREARDFALGVSLALLPFVIALIGAGSEFFRNVFQYGSNPELWGVQVLLFIASALPGVSQADVQSLAESYHASGKYLIVIAVLALSAWTWRRGLDRSKAVAAAFALFLILAPGFGLQYTAYLAPAVFAVSVRWGILYATVSGLFIGLVYAHFLISYSPLESLHNRSFPMSVAFLGFATWLTILAFLPRCFVQAPKDIER